MKTNGTFKGNVSLKPQSQGPPSNKFWKHIGYTVDINLMSFFNCTSFRLHAEKGGTRKEPLMLNIENKYKAFHISFYPHTSLTAGLNIFEKTFHSRRKRMHIHIYTCKWTCLPAIKPEVQTTIPSKSIHKKEKKQNKTNPPTQNLSVNLCTVRSLSRQLFKSWTLITVLRMEYQTLHYQTPPLWTQTRGPLWNPSFATDEWLLVL